MTGTGPTGVRDYRMDVGTTRTVGCTPEVPNLRLLPLRPPGRPRYTYGPGVVTSPVWLRPHVVTALGLPWSDPRAVPVCGVGVVWGRVFDCPRAISLPGDDSRHCEEGMFLSRKGTLPCTSRGLGYDASVATGPVDGLPPTGRTRIFLLGRQ